MSAHADKPYTGRFIILMILVLFSPYPFLKILYSCTNSYLNLHANAWRNISQNFVHEFKYKIRTNSYEFFCMKNWLCYEWSVLYSYGSVIFIHVCQIFLIYDGNREFTSEDFKIVCPSVEIFF